jgi:hypothetical protein
MFADKNHLRFDENPTFTSSDKFNPGITITSAAYNEFRKDPSLTARQRSTRTQD